MRWKLMGAFGAMCLAPAVVGAIGIGAAQSIKGNLDDTAGNYMPSMRALSRAQVAITRAQRDVRSAVLSEDTQEIESLVGKTRDGMAAAESAFAKYKTYPMNEAEKAGAAQYEQAYAAWKSALQPALAAAVQNTRESNARATDILLHQTTPLAAEATKSIENLVQIQEKAADDDIRDSNAAFESSLKLLAGAVAVGLLFGVAVARGA